MNDSISNKLISQGVIQVVSKDRIRRLEVCTQFSNLGYTVIPLVEFDFSQVTQPPSADVCVLLDQQTITEIGFSLDRIPKQNLIPVFYYLPLAHDEQNGLLNPVRSTTHESIVPFTELSSEDSIDNVRRLLDSAIKYARLSRDCTQLISELNARSSRRLIGYSQTIQTLKDRIADAVHSKAPVLIQGVPGSELSLIAEIIHDLAFIDSRPLIKLNCSILTTENWERELFGFYSQSDSKFSDELIWNPGRIEQAAGGTLILDQINRVSLPVQAILLKMISKREYHSPEDEQPKEINCRIISVSTAPLQELVLQNQFKRKLLSILAETMISVPRLNDRKEDLALLTETILSEVAQSEGMVPKLLTLDGLELLKNHDWPGDVQELRNLIRHVYLVENGLRLDATSLAPWIGAESVATADSLVGMTLREMEQKLIESTFARCGGNRENTAQMLDIGLRTLSGKLRSYGYPPRGGPDSKRKFTVKRAA